MSPAGVQSVHSGPPAPLPAVPVVPGGSPSPEQLKRRAAEAPTLMTLTRRERVIPIVRARRSVDFMADLLWADAAAGLTLPEVE
jgi:hypothetical protein